MRNNNALLHPKSRETQGTIGVSSGQPAPNASTLALLDLAAGSVPPARYGQRESQEAPEQKAK